MKKEIFKLLIKDFVEKDISHVKEREISIPLDVDRVVSLVGARRSGKTFILFILARRLRKQMPRENVIYVNFEDDRLFPLKLRDVDQLVQAYYELYPKKKDEKVYFLLDEIQNVPHWERFVRRLHDTENCRIYITGSSSRLLGREIATALRGRTVSYEVFPLSFKEFLAFKGVKYEPYSSRSQAEVKHLFYDYLLRGGFPEVVDYNGDLLLRTLKEYLDLVIYKNMVERHRITNLFVVRYLMNHLVRNLSNLMSPGKLYNDLKSQGLKISKNTVYEYMGFMEEAFLLFLVPLWTSSIRREWRNPKKVYVVDHGLKRVLDTQEDRGRVYENMAFLELRRRNPRITYFKERQEVDFYLEGEGLLINVCYDYSSPRTREREIKGLAEAMAAPKLNSSYLLTADQEEKIELPQGTIRALPLWKWLLW